MKQIIKAVVVILALSPDFAVADIAVIAHHDNSNAQLDLRTVAKIFLGKMRFFPDGSRVVPLDQDEGLASRDQFYQSLTKKSPSQIKSYWSRLIFAGKGTPPKTVGADAEVLELIATNPNMLGYIDAAMIDSRVKVVAKLAPVQAM